MSKVDLVNNYEEVVKNFRVVTLKLVNGEFFHAMTDDASIVGNSCPVVRLYYPMEVFYDGRSEDVSFRQYLECSNEMVTMRTDAILCESPTIQMMEKKYLKSAVRMCYMLKRQGDGNEVYGHVVGNLKKMPQELFARVGMNILAKNETNRIVDILVDYERGLITEDEKNYRITLYPGSPALETFDPSNGEVEIPSSVVAFDASRRSNKPH